MGKRKKQKPQETGGLQEPKLSVAEKQVLKNEKEKQRRKEKQKGEKRPFFLIRFFRWIGRTFREIGGELRKVRWPSFAKTVAQTGVVLGVVILFSLIIFAMDRGLGELYRLLVGNL